MRLLLAFFTIFGIVQRPVQSAVFLQATPCFAGDVGATFHNVAYAVTTLESAEHIAAQAIAQARKDCPQNVDCKVISVTVQVTQTRK